MGTVGTSEVTEAEVITTVRGDCGRETRGWVIVHRAHGLGAPPGPKPYSTAVSAVLAAAAVRRPIRVEMRPEGGTTIKGAGLPASKGKTQLDQ